MKFIRLLILGLVLLGSVSGCATRPTNPEDLAVYQQNNDPLEPMNRAIFRFNNVADEYVMAPAVKGYRSVLPETARECVGNFFSNLKQPLYFINAVLQGDFKSAATITGRFALNTVFGFFGVVDTASANEVPVIRRDFGQTLAVWGIKNSGPYLMLPLLGPSTVRDTAGLVVDAFADPVDWVLYDQSPWLAYGRGVVDGFLGLERAHDLMDDMKKNSTDYYATMRSMYQQNRKKEIAVLRGEKEEMKAEYDFDFPDDEDEE